MFLPAELQPQAESIAATTPHTWKDIRILDSMSPAAKRSALRLNALGSMFNFGYLVLGYTRSTRALHGQCICSELECEYLRKVLEFPRDFFKSTWGSIVAPMWWALPFTEDDEENMRALGYGDAWIRWMKWAHSSSTRTLIGSETTKNARKIGSNISGHYENNDVFRFVFSEILPRNADRWNSDSMTHRRLERVQYGEGTYDFIGAEVALQSNHYARHVLDDLYGEEARKSPTIGLALLGWFGRLVGCFDSIPGEPDRLGDQLVIGNRWGDKDLNSHLRKKAKQDPLTAFQFITHSAEGGCCPKHPKGESIFPQEFSMRKLALIRGSLESAYDYSCHYLNDPTDPEACRFKARWLRHYQLAEWPEEILTHRNTVNYPQWANVQETRAENGLAPFGFHNLETKTSDQPRRLKVAMNHEAKQGEVIDDIRAGELDRVCILDPNHGAETGRSRNAILCYGLYRRNNVPWRMYLLDVWAKASGHEEWIEAAIGKDGLAQKWRVHYLYLESDAAGQQGWKFYFKERMKNLGRACCWTLRDLITDKSNDAKMRRIEGMEPIYENGYFWTRRVGHELFTDEYDKYPNGATFDLLDLAGYIPQTLGIGSRAQARDFMTLHREQQAKAVQSIGAAGY